MIREELSLVARWQMVEGHLRRDWCPTPSCEVGHEAASLSQFNAEMLTWLAPYAAAARLL